MVKQVVIVVALLVFTIAVVAYVAAEYNKQPLTTLTTSASTVAETSGGNGKAFKAVMYATRTCGCCHKYVEYLEKNGVEVEVVHVSEAQLYNEKLSVAPQELYSCHIMEVEGYYVIGHVPIEAIVKLLAEKPSIRGISLPGMPGEAPGMGNGHGKFTIYYFDKDSYGVYTVIET